MNQANILVVEEPIRKRQPQSGARLGTPLDLWRPPRLRDFFL